MNRFRNLLVLAIGAVAFCLFGVPSGSAHAYTNSRLMDDQIFDNVNTMSEAQIQAFLTSKGPCLANYMDVDPNYSVSTGWTYTSSVPASHVIYKAAQQWGLNPQVIIATLQKEESLISGTDCSNIRMTSAMGYGCPDGNARYDYPAIGVYQTCVRKQNWAGFSRQVLWGAWQLKFNKERAYGNTAWDGDGDITYVGLMTQGDRKRCDTCATVFYDGNATIDGQQLHMDNGTTASFYTYTPHLGQSLPGIFEGWFGPTLLPTFGASLYYQSPYPSMRAGQTASVTFSYLNSGTVLWRDDRTAASFGQFPIHLATAQPTNRLSDLGASWPSKARPALVFNKVYDIVAGGVTLAADQTVVNPGQIAEFTFSLTTTTDRRAGTQRESFFPVREGTTSWYMGGLAWLDATILPTSYSPSFVGQSPYPSLKAGEVSNTYFDVRNSGNTNWYDESSHPTGIAPVTLATSIPINRDSAFSASWLSRSRPTSTFSKVFEADGVTLAGNQHVAQPGQIVRFNFAFIIPVDTKAGMYREFFTPILEGASNWNIGTLLWQDVTVAPTTFSASFAGQSAYPTIPKGGHSNAFFMLKNIGNSFWHDSTSAPSGISPVHLATSSPINRQSSFADSWISSSRPAMNFAKVYEADGVTLATDQHTAGPGQIARFEFSLGAKADAISATSREYFTPVLEGAKNWNFGPQIWLDITVP